MAKKSRILKRDVNISLSSEHGRNVSHDTRKDEPTEQSAPLSPRSGLHGNKPGCYGLVLRVSKAVVDPGEQFEIEVYLSGYGEIQSSKLCFYPSPGILDCENSFAYHGLKRSGGKLVFGADKHRLDATGNSVILDGGIRLPKWHQSTMYFDTPTPQGQEQTPHTGRQLATETKHVYAPLHLQVKAVKKGARAGTHSVHFLFTYFNGTTWQNSSQVAQFTVRNLYQRYELFVLCFGAVATVFAFMRGISDIVAWISALFSPHLPNILI